MSLNLQIPENVILKPCITVFGVGGAGGNAVNNMISSNLEGAKFVVANTDAQALEYSLSERKIQLGESLTRGLGAGAAPDIGKAAAEEAMNEILEHLNGSNMVFITAGMGGGTGTGAAPVIARAAREQGVLTVGVVTKPFHFEGLHRMRIAESGLSELQKHVDTLIVIPNQNLFRIANEKTTFADAFKMADDVLHAGVRGVTDLMIMPGLINLDFADIRTVMSEMGKAMMGTGEANGEKRALLAAEAAISNPLLDHCSMKGARGVLINITGGPDMTLFEVDEAANRIREEVDPEAKIIFGSTFNPELEGKIRVSVVATGIESASFGQETKASSTQVQSNVNIIKDKEEVKESINEEIVKEEIEEMLEDAESSDFESIFGDEFEDDSEPVFVAPQAMEPKFQSRSNNNLPQDEEYFHTRIRSENRLDQLEEKKNEYNQPAKSGLSLFGRMTNAFRSAPKESPQPHKSPEIKVTETNNDKAFKNRNDDLDVPAYLRRKKTDSNV